MDSTTRSLGGDLAHGLARVTLVLGTVGLWLLVLWPNGHGAPAYAAGILAVGAGLLWLWRRAFRDALAGGVGALGAVLGLALEPVNPLLGYLGLAGAVLAALILTCSILIEVFDTLSS